MLVVLHTLLISVPQSHDILRYLLLSLLLVYANLATQVQMKRCERELLHKHMSSFNPWTVYWACVASFQ